MLQRHAEIIPNTLWEEGISNPGGHQVSGQLANSAPYSTPMDLGAPYCRAGLGKTLLTQGLH